MLRLTVIGRIGRDAEIKEFDGRKCIDFSVAEGRRVRSKTGTGYEEKTTWINCSYWTEYTNVAATLKKGIRVYAEGVPEAHAYMKEDKLTAGLRLRVSSVEIIDSPGRPTSDSQAAAPPTTDESV